MVAYLVHLSRENRLLKATLRCCGLGRNIKRIGTVFAMKARHHRRSRLEEPPFEDLVDTVVDDDVDQGSDFRVSKGGVVSCGIGCLTIVAHTATEPTPTASISHAT